MSIEVKYSGSLFDGTAQAKISDALSDAEQKIGERAVALVLQTLKRSIRHSTGRYERAVSATNRQGTLLVTDGGIVYGPWLEGVASRNHKTRFKGYSAFRKAAQALQEEAGRMAEDAIEQAVSSL